MNLFGFASEQDSDIYRRSLLYNVNWFISLRWAAAISIFGITFFSTRIFKLGLEEKRLYLLGTLVIIYNIFIFLWLRASQTKYDGRLQVVFARISAHMQIVLDMVTLGFLIHFSGGVESPFLFIFIFHPIFAAVILSAAEAYFYTVVSIAIVGSVSIFEHTRMIPHYHIAGFLPSENIDSLLFSAGSLFAFSIIQIIAVVIISVIMKGLRKKQAEVEKIKQELEEKNARLKKKDEMRLLFLASATHDLKSPLNTITSYIRSLADGYMGEVAEDQKRVLLRILLRINGLRQLINDVLKLGEIEMEDGKGKNLEKFDIIKLLSESVDEFKSLAKEHGVSVIFEPQIKRVIVLADPAQIDEVIHNYISNAIKYNRENGRVTICAEITGNNVKISVSDTGLGIKEEEIPRVFSDFFRSPEVKRLKIEGSGLGLGIVKRIVERFGGSVGVTSKYQEGSTFYFTLPVAESEDVTAGTA